MKTQIKTLSQFVLAAVLFVLNTLASAELPSNPNVCEAGFGSGTWPVWAAMLAILALSMYAKVALAED